MNYEQRLEELEARLAGHAELITSLYARIRVGVIEANTPIPRIYLPILETRPKTRKPVKSEKRDKAQRFTRSA